MDRKELIDEIVARVAEKLAACEDGETVEQICSDDARPGLPVSYTHLTLPTICSV